MENLNLILPEIFLSLSIFVTLLIGVFFKDSYKLVTNITYLIIISLLLIILSIHYYCFFLFWACSS